MQNKVIEVADGIFGKVLNEYVNGYETTAGFVKKQDAKFVDCVSITFDAEHDTELPTNWDEIVWLTEWNTRQYISEIRFGTEWPYIMADGTKSRSVTYDEV